MARVRLGELLVEAGVISEGSLRLVLQIQLEHRAPIGRLLIEEGLIQEPVLIQALESQLGIPAVELDEVTFDASCKTFVTFEQAVELGLLVFKVESRSLFVAMMDPTQAPVIDDLQTQTMMAVRPFLTGPQTFARAVERLYEKPVPFSHRVVRAEERLSARIRQLETELAQSEDAIQQLIELCVDGGVAVPQSLQR